MIPKAGGRVSQQDHAPTTSPDHEPNSVKSESGLSQVAPMDWDFLFNSFDGRIGRKTFWIAMAVLTVSELFGHLLAEQIEGDRLSAIVDLAFTYPEFAVAIKRAHDRNLPVWLLIVFFTAGAALDLLTVLELTGSEEEPEPAVAGHRPAVLGAGHRLAGRAWLPQGRAGPQSARSRSARTANPAAAAAADLNRPNLRGY